MTDMTTPEAQQKKADRKKRFRTRLIIGGLAGIVVGIGASYLSGQLGSSCTIMCNPYVAGSLGGVLGMSMGVSE
jgi:uncharacterized membrane protein